MPTPENPFEGPEELKKKIGVYRPPPLKNPPPESESAKSDRLLRQVMGMPKLSGPRSQAEIDEEHNRVRGQIGQVAANSAEEPPRVDDKKPYKL